MNTNHTPGPWRSTHDGLIIACCNNQSVARVSKFDLQDRDANALLIAAAPELLGLLRELVRLAESGREVPADTLRAAKNTIAKAITST